MKLIVRLLFAGFLIWQVALGEIWALVLILALLTLAHEGTIIMLDRIRHALMLDELFKRKLQ